MNNIFVMTQPALRDVYMDLSAQMSLTRVALSGVHTSAKVETSKAWLSTSYSRNIKEEKEVVWSPKWSIFS